MDGTTKASFSWFFINNGRDDIKLKGTYGYSRYDFSRNKWVEVYSTPIEFDFSGNIGGIGFGTSREVEPGYYMSWVKIKARGDLIGQNNVDKSFAWIDRSNDLKTREIVYEEIA